MEEYPTSDGACGDNAEASRRLFERYLKIDEYDDDKFTSDLAECSDLLSPDLVEVLTQPMSPEKETIASKNRDEKENIEQITDEQDMANDNEEEDEVFDDDFEENMQEKAQKLREFVKGQRNENTNRKTSQVCV